MINVNEVRIGNLVWDDYSGEMIVTQIKLHSMDGDDSVNLRKTLELPSGKYLCKDIDPIPLTEEWLLKFKLKTWNHNIIKEDRWGRKYYNYQIGDIEVYLEYSIQYVHQLQNLYFALKGTELTIKP